MTFLPISTVVGYLAQRGNGGTFFAFGPSVGTPLPVIDQLQVTATQSAAVPPFQPAYAMTATPRSAITEFS